MVDVYFNSDFAIYRLLKRLDIFNLDDLKIIMIRDKYEDKFHYNMRFTNPLMFLNKIGLRYNIKQSYKLSSLSSYKRLVETCVDDTPPSIEYFLNEIGCLDMFDENN